jgi:uncharacterized protein
MTRVLMVTTIAIVVAVAGIGAQAPARPTFDCAKATGEIETLICKDPALIALDRKLVELFAAAIKKLPSRIANDQRTLQRTWTTSRNECVEADDVRACTELTYQMRIVELQIVSGQVKGGKPVEFVCVGGEDRPLAVTSFATEPRSALVQFGGDRVIAFIARSASGSRYTAANVDFSEDQGKATLTWYGSALSCRLVM